MFQYSVVSFFINADMEEEGDAVHIHRMFRGRHANILVLIYASFEAKRCYNNIRPITNFYTAMSNVTTFL